MNSPLVNGKPAELVAGSNVTTIPFTLANPVRCKRQDVPISHGVCLPRGLVTTCNGWSVTGSSGQALSAQTEILARWPDGSAKWVLVDFVADHIEPGRSEWSITTESVDTFDAKSKVEMTPMASGLQLQIDDRPLLPIALQLHDHEGRSVATTWESVSWDATGPVRWSAHAIGALQENPLRVAMRIDVFPATGLVRCDVTLHNPQAAQHQGGLWDLGDPGSVFFQDFAVEVPAILADSSSELSWQLEPGTFWKDSDQVEFHLHQESSGGENWRNETHVDRTGRVPSRYRGYRVSEPTAIEGLHAEPIIKIQNANQMLQCGVPEFWQQFPKALRVCDDTVIVELFPQDWPGGHELQGGERKTHTIWLHTSATDETQSLEWIHRPVRAILSSGWIDTCGVFRPVTCSDSVGRVDPYLKESLSGMHSISRRREITDEYGWRNFGDIRADHEQAEFAGEAPIVSHYNNQFDLVFGGILQLTRTGDPTWWELFDPLARHVMDIDIYHTEADKAAYSGGMFWHTDHFQHARTSTHRTYSRANRPDGKDYGGGPSNEHNYTTGLLTYHYLTGSMAAKEAVIGLADWVIRMDDGRRTILGVVDDGPTGLASATCGLDNQVPGRGAGNSLNACLDAWELTGEDRFLTFAETLIARCVHPDDDVTALDLLNAELRWSYVVFLTSLAKYLDLKTESEQFDDAFDYARASLLHYVRWMLQHESPWLDRADELDYPNETWAAQEMRKANVLRWAARYTDDAELRRKLCEQGNAWADRAWSDLNRFENRTVARCVSVLMTEGARDASFRDGVETLGISRPLPTKSYPPRVPFVPQKTRVKAMLKRPTQWASIALRMMNPRRWRSKA
ncbi:RIFT barrel domain-containing protein [Thalassoroseus pseudoceratinae]|uniref:RIFT barrel domain-containing protein n=1 Tax=Thalassoroseus pseudoceratinae TaxID=2713176 RepID=UPI00142011F3|nr:hypothetical protein [Thalassoroseus pseudoceratinae]